MTEVPKEFSVVKVSAKRWQVAQRWRDCDADSWECIGSRFASPISARNHRTEMEAAQLDVLAMAAKQGVIPRRHIGLNETCALCHAHICLEDHSAKCPTRGACSCAHTEQCEACCTWICSHCYDQFLCREECGMTLCEGCAESHKCED